MSRKDPRVDAYIANAGNFAKPILQHLRKLVHANCPEVEETLKWNSPFFMYKGILCNMAAFKEHCSFGFWKGELVLKKKATAHGQFGRITALSDLPKDTVLAGYIRKAVALKDSGIKEPVAPKPKTTKELEVPNYITAALKQNRKALATFEEFSYSHKKEYVTWIVDAKQEETRQRRLATMLQWLIEGKSRHWKYQNC
jgi:uncharacterized protein YdeI (YjbR/CyaY-like superfamily)